jgi:AcrR family transcriptional regulator
MNHRSTGEAVSKVTEAHVEARRDDILNAALALFASRGVEDTTMSDIADDAGISAGAIYRYFPGKEELIRECCLRVQREAQALMGAAQDSASGPLDSLERAGLAIVRDDAGICVDPALMLEFGLRSSRDNEEWGNTYREAAEATLTAVRRAVEQAQASGEIGASFDAATIAVLLYALVPGLRVASLQVRAAEDSEAVMRLAIDLLRRTGNGGRAAAVTNG